jgi:hypothetical protein
MASPRRLTTATVFHRSGGATTARVPRAVHSLTSQREWARYMPGGAFKRPYHPEQHPRYPKGTPGGMGGKFMMALNGAPTHKIGMAYLTTSEARSHLGPGAPSGVYSVVGRAASRPGSKSGWPRLMTYPLSSSGIRMIASRKRSQKKTGPTAAHWASIDMTHAVAPGMDLRSRRRRG